MAISARIDLLVEICQATGVLDQLRKRPMFRPPGETVKGVFVPNNRLLAFVMLMGEALLKHTVSDLLVVGTALLITAALAAPLFRHLVNTPVDVPGHLPERSAQEDSVAAAIDKYSTRWGSEARDKERDRR